MAHFPDLEVVVDGEKWYSFSISFDVGSKEYGIYIYAKSFDHAGEMLAALKSSGRVTGQNVEFIEVDDSMDLSADRVLN